MITGHRSATALVLASLAAGGCGGGDTPVKPARPTVKEPA